MREKDKGGGIMERLVEELYTFYGDYFWETEYPRQYLHMEFHV